MRSNGADPHRVLGVARDATEGEIKRAYRALAKRHHPDAGQGSVARFLEIQAAYETLVGGASASGAGGAASARPSPASRRPAQPGGSGGTPGGASAPGEGARAPAQGAEWARRPRGGSARRPGAGSAGGTGSPGPGPAGDAAPRPPGARGGPRPDDAPRGRRASGRRRATLGSTSYDGAEDAFEPDWGGATWYGPSSGTYWTINPKEYADPRKHGPEYQARARRRRGGAAGPGAGSRDAESGAGDGAASGAGSGEPAAFDATEASRVPPRKPVIPGARGGGLPPSWRAHAWTAAAPPGAERVAFEHDPAPDGGPSGGWPEPGGPPPGSRGPVGSEPAAPRPAPRPSRATTAQAAPGPGDRDARRPGRCRVARPRPGARLARRPPGRTSSRRCPCRSPASRCWPSSRAPRGSRSAAAWPSCSPRSRSWPWSPRSAARTTRPGPRRRRRSCSPPLAWTAGVLLVGAGRVAPYPWRTGRVTATDGGVVRQVARAPAGYDHHVTRRAPSDLSSAAQEYLLALRVAAGDGCRVTTAHIARQVGVTTQAASEMVRRLAADGLVAQGEGRELILTAPGRAAADAIFRRHALLEWLLTTVVGLGWAESDVEAARLQGAISPRVEARLDELLGHPETCPHGNPIDVAAAERRPPGVPLAGLEAGSRATIYRITEAAEEDPGAPLVPGGARPDARRPRHDPGPLRVAGRRHARGADRARHARPPAGRAGPRPVRRGRPRALPPRPGRGPPGLTDRRPGTAATAPGGGHDRRDGGSYNRGHDRRPRPHRAQPHRAPPHRHGPHGALQLPLRPPRRRHVHPPPRGHRPGPLDRRLRARHPGAPPLAGAGVGRGARPPADCRSAGRSGRIARWRACRATRRRPSGSWPQDRAYPCYCTPEELEADRRAQEAAKQPAALRRPLRDPYPRRAGRPRGRGPPARAPLPDRARSRRLRRPGPGPRRDRRLRPRRRPRDRPRRRDARSTTSRWWWTTPRWGSPTSSAARTTSPTRPSTSSSSGRWATPSRSSPTCRSSSTPTARR